MPHALNAYDLRTRTSACSRPTPEAPTSALEQPANTTTAFDTAVPDPNARSDNPAFIWDDVDQDPELIGRWFYTVSDDGAFTSAGGEDTEVSFIWVCDRASSVCRA